LHPRVKDTCALHFHGGNSLTSVRVGWPQIQAWHSAGGDAAATLWRTLAAANADVEAALASLLQLSATLPRDDYDAGVALCASLPAVEVRQCVITAAAATTTTTITVL
jgi:hypothetical protein